MIHILKWAVNFSGLLIFILLTGCLAAPAEEADGQNLHPGVNIIMSVSSTGEKTNSIPVNDDAKVEIIFLDEASEPVRNERINISATSGSLSQSTVLTDSSGSSIVTINPPELTTGSAPGIFTATPELSGEATIFNYQFVATTNAETTEEAAKFATSLQFISADPTFLSLKGTGGVGYGELSKLTFKVVDNEGNPISNVRVNFKLTTTVGGLSLNAESAISNDQGEAFVTVLAGTISTPVRVTASVTKEDGSLLSVQSDLLTVTTGIPDQNSFSLAVSKFAPEGFSYDGETSIVSVALADRFNNPVPDGTVVNFTTEGGVIESTCQTSNGRCSVTWTSQNPRVGRANILAYAIGHETYYDKNGSGIFDDGDTFVDLGELFRDDDESLTFNPYDSVISQDEKLIDYDENGSYTGPDGVYNGIPCNHSTDCPIDANNIAGRSNFLVNVGRNTIIVMASSSPRVHLYELLNGNITCLDTNGKLVIDGVQCQIVSQNFLAGADFKELWVLIENPEAVCKTSETGTRIDNVFDPEDPACIYAERLSAPTGSSISVTSEVGTISSTPGAVESQTTALEFSFTATADNQNIDPVTGNLEVLVRTPKAGNEVSDRAVLTDPAN